MQRNILAIGHNILRIEKLLTGNNVRSANLHGGEDFVATVICGYGYGNDEM